MDISSPYIRFHALINRDPPQEISNQISATEALGETFR